MNKYVEVLENNLTAITDERDARDIRIKELEAEVAEYVKFLKDNGITQDQDGEFECADCEIYLKNKELQAKNEKLKGQKEGD